MDKDNDNIISSLDEKARFVSQKPGPQSILEDLKAIKEQVTSIGSNSETTGTPLETGTILKQMLDVIGVVDFHTELGITDSDTKPKQSDKIVIVISQILALAEANQWAITLREGSVYLYNGQFWQSMPEDEVRHFLAHAAEKMGIRKADAQFFEFKERLYKQLLSAAYEPFSEPDADRVRINLLNGTFEVTRTGSQLRAFCKEHFLRYQLPFPFDPEASCPRFLAYLDRVLPNKELQNILAEFIGYVFTHNLKLEKCLVLYGTGANGKSVFYEVSTALLGQENVLTYNLTHFKSEYNRAALSGKLLNYGSEMNAGLENDLFKMIASGEALQARHPYGKPFTIRSYAKMAFNANELPRDVEHTEAYFRRLLIIPFNVTIPEHERDPDLAQYIIRNELAGVFNWVLAGLNRLLNNRAFTTSSIIQQTVNQYRSESDTVASFLADYGYVANPNAKILLKDLYTQYRTFCAEGGSRALSQQNFSSRLRRHLGFTVERENRGNVVYASFASQAA